MPHAAARFRPHIHTLTAFLATMCALGGALTWLCWRLLQLDRELESRRVEERLEQAADRISGALTAQLQELDRWFQLATNGSNEAPPPGVALLTIAEHRASIVPRGLLYRPDTAPTMPGGSDADALFTVGERSEYQARDASAAAEYFRALATSSGGAVRAGALVRLARNLRKLGRYPEALEVYGHLSLLKNVSIDGVPAELLAADARCGVLETMGRQEESQKEALRMDADLRGGRWPVAGSVWEFYRNEVRRWAIPNALTEAEEQSLALARATEWIYRLGLGPLEPKGRRILAFENRAVFVSWMSSAGHTAAALMLPDALGAAWKQATQERGTRAALIDPDGAVLLGSLPSHTRQAVRSPAVIGVPATLVVMPSDPAADMANSAVHRRFLLAGFTVMGLVLAAGCIFILHSMARERAVARMQSEFVSTVSHEFRTPLTSLRQLSEMLVHDRISSETDRRQSYEVMFHASERLQRLVESLLDFGRMEAAAFRYHFDSVDVRALVERVVREFRGEAAQGHSVEVSQAEDVPAIRADAEAIGVAMWNLLDNAAKYSPQFPTVWVDVRREQDLVAITVRDRGMGVSRKELGLVFNRFFRGAAAQRGNIRGTGIGLSIAHHVVRAHGGDIRLTSQPGEGTTVTIVLPVEKQA